MHIASSALSRGLPLLNILYMLTRLCGCTLLLHRFCLYTFPGASRLCWVNDSTFPPYKQRPKAPLHSIVLLMYYLCTTYVLLMFPVPFFNQPQAAILPESIRDDSPAPSPDISLNWFEQFIRCYFGFVCERDEDEDSKSEGRDFRRNSKCTV